jgi:hypothetical protein
MKTIRTYGAFAILLLTSLFIFSCQKTGVVAPQNSDAQSKEEFYQTGSIQADGSVIAGGVTITAPTTVNVNESFNITAEINCGRVAIERGYILAGDGITKIYKGLTCASGNLLWEEVLTFQCYTTDANWTGSLSEAGTYVFRTKHNAADGNCDGLGGNNQSGNCSFTGNQVYCFSIEAISCQTAFTGEAIACGNARQAVYTFSSSDALNYIKIQGGLTNFTGADAIVTISGGNLTSSQSTPGGSSNRVIKIEGSVAACEVVTITISWNSTNTGGIITGDWSVKNANGDDVAPPVEGLTCGTGRFVIIK